MKFYVKLLIKKSFMRIFFIFLILFLSLEAFVFSESKNMETLNLLEDAQVYHDMGSQENIYSIIEKADLFVAPQKEFIDYCNLVDESVWIKFTLKNDTKHVINKVIGIDNILNETIELYEVQNRQVLRKQTTGMMHREEFAGIINFHLPISLQANTTHTYYLKVGNKQLSLWFKPLLYDPKSFLKEDSKKQLIWALFVGAILSLILYNLFLSIFTKDMIYLYYSAYLAATLMQNEFALYAKFYFFPMEDADFVKKDFNFSIFYINFLVQLTMSLFIRNFLQTKQYPKIDLSLKILIATILIYYILQTFFDLFALEVVILFLFITPYYFLWIGFYAFYKKNPQAKFFLIGWSFALLGWLTLFFQHMGIIPIRYIFSYTFESLIITESILFAIFLAYRIKNLEKKKNTLTHKLLEKQKNESKRLEVIVQQRTRELNKELKQNELLLKELHHRVKNNMQFITSLYALKLNENADTQMHEKLHDVERKIHAMSIVHQMLYKQKNLESINAKEYFEKVLESIKHSFELEHISFDLSINARLDVEEAIYCGLIVNELVTNAIKHAFDEKNGCIKISLNNDKDGILLEVSDNGKGLTLSDKASFGQMMVESLATEQLEGKLDIKVENGTKISLWFYNKIQKI